MKKWLIIGIVAALLVGGLVGYFISQGGAPELGAPGEGKPVTSGTIQVPGGPKIKVVFNGPPELKVNWEKLGVTQFELHLIGTLTNVSSQTVKFSSIAFLLDGEQVAFIRGPSIYGENLEPGEQMEIAKGFVGYTEYTKVLEVKIKGFEIVGGTVTTPERAEEVTPPKMTPEEVVMEWLDLAKEGKFSEAEKFYTARCKEYLDSFGGWEKAWEEYAITEIKILRTEGAEDVEANVYMIVYFADGTVCSDDCYIHFEKINNEWKIAFFELE